DELVMDIEQSEHAGFIAAHLPAEADDVGEHDRREFAGLSRQLLVHRGDYSTGSLRLSTGVSIGRPSVEPNRMDCASTYTVTQLQLWTFAMNSTVQPSSGTKRKLVSILQPTTASPLNERRKCSSIHSFVWLTPLATKKRGMRS